MANSNYAFTITHNDTEFDSYDAAIAWLQNYKYHLVGQFIQLKYKKNNELRTLLALGTRNFNDASLTNPETAAAQVGETSSNTVNDAMYEIIADTGDNDDDNIDTALAQTTIKMGGMEYQVASHGKDEYIGDPLEWDILDKLSASNPNEYDKENPRKVFKKYPYGIKNFQILLSSLASAAEQGTNEYARKKLEDINNSIVIISDFTGENTSSPQGTHIYAKGTLFTFNPDVASGAQFNRSLIINGTKVVDFVASTNDAPVIGDPFEWRKLEKRSKTNENQQSSN